MTRSSLNYNTNNLVSKLQLGKKDRNEKTKPKTLNPANHEIYIDNVDKLIDYLGSASKKPKFLDNTWDSKTNFEMESSATTRVLYDTVRSSNGAQLCHALSNLYQKIMHLKTSLGNKDNIYVPPNGAFIAIIPKEHAPVSSKTCDLPFIFIARETVNSGGKIGEYHEHEFTYSTENYVYYI